MTAERSFEPPQPLAERQHERDLERKEREDHEPRVDDLARQKRRERQDQVRDEASAHDGADRLRAYGADPAPVEPHREERDGEDRIEEQDERLVRGQREGGLPQVGAERVPAEECAEKCRVRRREVGDERRRGRGRFAPLSRLPEEAIPLVRVAQHREKVREEPAVERASALAPVMVHHLRGGHVENLVPRLTHPVAPVDVLEVHEEALVHQPDAIDRLAPDEKARADQPVDLADRGVVPVRHEMAANDSAVRKEPAEGRAPPQKRLPIVERAARELDGAVGVEESAADDPRFGMRVEEADHLADRVAAQLDVRVEDEDQLAARSADALVDGARVADVLAVPDEAERWPRLREPLRERRVGRVVEDENFVRRRERRRGDRVEARREEVRRRVVDDDDRETRGVVRAAQPTGLRKNAPSLSLHTIPIASQIIDFDIFEVP